MTERRPRKPYTPFGKLLRHYMWQRDIRAWTELEIIIEAVTSNKHSHQSMSKYAAGTVQIPCEFVQDFADTLSLNEEERTDLAEKFTYQSRQAHSHSNSA